MHLKRLKVYKTDPVHLGVEQKFPIVIIPAYIAAIRESLPKPVLPKPENPTYPTRREIVRPYKPSPPIKLKTIIKWDKLLVICFCLPLSILFCWMAATTNNSSNTTLFSIIALLPLLPGIVFVFGTINDFADNDSFNKKQVSEYPIKLKQYEHDIEQYPLLVEQEKEEHKHKLFVYDLALKNYRTNLKEYNKYLNEDAVTEFRKSELLKAFAKNKKPVQRSELITITKGVSEDIFFNELKDKFCSSSASGKELDVAFEQVIEFSDEGGYYPDIVIHDKADNLLIDIEIDEPYVSSSLDPIHYIGSDDTFRDDYFVDNGWIVIRFAEEQIIKYKKQCADFIEYIIELVFDCNKDLQDIQKYINSKGFMISQWSNEEAKLMASNRYRNIYLGRELIEKLPAASVQQDKKYSKPKPVKSKYESIDDLPF